ncbi:MAG: hypothetical protein ACRD47_09060 [Nitrososphaeraceae archaeon]
MSIGLFITMNIGSNLSESFSTRERQAEFESVAQPFMTGLAFAFIFYIIALVLTFVLRNVATIGIILLALGGISIPITNYYGIIPFALLLPAAVVSFRERQRQAATKTHQSDGSEIG